jgi:chromosome segregation ATPase
MNEEGINNIVHLGKETRTDFDELRNTLNGFREEIKKMAEEVKVLNEKIKEGFIEVKDELGSMIKFSYADLEKKLNALEARIKALEKMVFP